MRKIEPPIYYYDRYDPNLIVEEALLREPNLWTPGKKPVGNVKIDWSNPLTNLMHTCYLCGDSLSPINLANNVQETWTPSGSPYLSVFNGSKVISSTSGSEGRITTDNASVWNAYPRTVFLIFTPYSAAENYSFNVDSTTDNDPLLLLGCNASGEFKADLRGNANPYVGLIAGSVNVGEINYAAIVQKKSNNHKLYGNNPWSPLASSTTTLVGVNFNEFGINGRDRAGGVNGLGHTHFICGWKKALDNIELNALFTDPYQFLIPA
jgi:hypothetical protein